MSQDSKNENSKDLLRKKLQDLFPLDSDFKAFVSDYFPGISAKLTDTMDRTSCITVVLTSLATKDLTDALRRWAALRKKSPGFPGDDIEEFLEPLIFDEITTYQEQLELERSNFIIEGKDPTALDKKIRNVKKQREQSPAVVTGLLLDNRYKMMRIMGEGGFAQIWEAFDRKNRQTVAVKVLHSQKYEIERLKSRFYRANAHLATLTHQNIIRLLDGPKESNGFHFLVMELLSSSLHEAIIERKINPRDALDVILQICDALSFAHDRGYVHRDVKPQNILINNGNAAKLADFDTLWARRTTLHTRKGAIIGTIIYAAPEQLADASKPGVEADVYSLGMTAVFSILGTDIPLNAHNRNDETISRLTCSEDMKQVLRKAVSFESKSRYASISEFQSALRFALKTDTALPDSWPTELDISNADLSGDSAPFEKASQDSQDSFVAPNGQGARRFFWLMAKRFKWLWLIVGILALAIISGSAINFFAPRFDHYETERIDTRLRLNSFSTLMLTGSRLSNFQSLWINDWLKELTRKGITVAGDISSDGDGSSLRVNVKLPDDFNGTCLPSPTMPFFRNNLCLPIKVTLSVSAAIISWKDDDLPEYKKLIRQLIANLRNLNMYPHIIFDEQPEFVHVEQSEFRQLAPHLGKFDFLVAPPYALTVLKHMGGDFAPKVVACSRREAAPSHPAVQAGRSPSTYQALLVTKKENALADALHGRELAHPDDILSLGIAKDVRFEVYGTNKGSASGYILPCLAWGRALSILRHSNSEWKFKGNHKDLLREILLPGEQIVRLGAVNSEFVTNRLPQEMAGSFTVVWRSIDIPNGSVSIIGRRHPVKEVMLPTAMEATLQDIAEHKIQLPFKEFSEANTIGTCNQQAFKGFEEFLKQHPKDSFCDL